MDKALELRMVVDQYGKVEDPLLYLNKSELIEKYKSLKDLTILGEIFALIGLAEIPYSYELAFVKNLVDSINAKVSTDEGFSYTVNLKISFLVTMPCFWRLILA